MAEPAGEGLCSQLFLPAGSLSDGLDVWFDVERGGWVVNNVQLSCGFVDNIIAVTIASVSLIIIRLIKSVCTE